MNTEIIDAEFEEIEDGILQIVPKKKSKWKRTVCELIGIVFLSQIIARVLFLILNGV